MSRTRDSLVTVIHGFPRVSGDEPDVATRWVLPPAFSPREWG